MAAITDYFLPRNPVTEQREIHLIPAFAEKAIGWMAYPFYLFVGGGVITEKNGKFGRYAQMVQEIGQKLAAQCPRKDLNFEFKVINTKEDEAWCLPGGKIAISRGLIKHLEDETTDYGLGDISMEDKVAAVLSHEMIHAAACHYQREILWTTIIPAVISVASFAITLWIEYYYFGWTELFLEVSFAAATSICSFIVSSIELGYSRAHELESDKYGIHLMKKCGMNVNAPLYIMSYFNTYYDGRIGYWWFDRIVHYLSSHPVPEERLAANRVTIQTLLA